jgi:GT2 family glycosyltransferase
MKRIGFVIITYNRPEDMLALMQNICQLNEKETLLEEVIIVNNHSTSNYTLIEEFVNENKHIPFKYIVSNENLGVAKGRNFAIKQSKAPIIIMLDDDAELEGKDALIHIDELYARQGASLAIVSFKVIYYSTRQMQQNAFPHKQFDKKKDLHSFETYYYAGGAHAISRDAIEKANFYPEDFFYGMEEYDLSYRLLDCGFKIIYSDSIVMLHKESPLGRQPTKQKLKMLWLNKSKVAWRYLPSIYFITTFSLWSIEYLKKSKFDIIGFVLGWSSIFSIPYKEKRKRIKAKTLQHLIELEARLYY